MGWGGWIEMKGLGVERVGLAFAWMGATSICGFQTRLAASPVSPAMSAASRAKSVPATGPGGGGSVPPPPVYLTSHWQDREPTAHGVPYTYAQIYDLEAIAPPAHVFEAACPPEVLAKAMRIAQEAGVRCIVDGGHLHVFKDATDGLTAAHYTVAEVMVRILNELIEADVLQEDDMREPEECLWPLETLDVVVGAGDGGLPPPQNAAACPHSALDLLAAFGGRRTFSLVGAEAIGNKTREDQWGWLAIRFSGIRNEEWIAEGVDAHVTLTYPG